MSRSAEATEGMAGSGRSRPVGRERELQTLSAALDDAATGQGSTVLIEGEAGLGKTGLAEWAASEARGGGFLVLSGRCWEAGGAPAYWPWTQIVRSLLDQVDGETIERHIGTATAAIGQIAPEILRLVESRRSAPPDELDRFITFDETSSFFRSLTRQYPILVILEDLHAADEATLHLTRFLAAHTKDTRLLLLGTYDEAEARRTEVSPLLDQIAREGRKIHLSGLDKASIAELFETELGRRPEDAELDAIHQATEGNPFFVSEMTKLLAGQGDIHRPDQSLGFRVPEAARDVLRRRLAPLPEECLRVLSVASVIGREFDVGLLREACGIPADALLDSLNDAVKSGVLHEVSALGRYSFAHVLIRESLYEDLTSAERMRLHHDIATTLEERHAQDLEPYYDSLSHHYFKSAQAGDSAKTIDYTLRAAEGALKAGAHEQAGRLFRRALRVAEMAGLSAERRKSIEVALKESQRRGEQVAEATTASDNVFRRDGEFWTIVFDGSLVRMKDTKGLRYLVQLLRNPDKEIHVLDLVSLVEGGKAAQKSARRDSDSLSVGLDDAGEILDRQAKAEYRRRLEDLQDQAEEAEQFNDPERAAAARAEMDALLEQLGEALGLGGRDRRAASNVERCPPERDQGDTQLDAEARRGAPSPRASSPKHREDGGLLLLYTGPPKPDLVGDLIIGTPVHPPVTPQ